VFRRSPSNSSTAGSKYQSALISHDCMKFTGYRYDIRVTAI